MAFRREGVSVRTTLFIPGKKIRASEISRLAAVIEEVSRRIDCGEADPRYGLWVDLG
jgi:hypothetical protein